MGYTLIFQKTLGKNMLYSKCLKLTEFATESQMLVINSDSVSWKSLITQTSESCTRSQLSPWVVYPLSRHCLPYFDELSPLCTGKGNFKMVTTIQFWWMVSTCMLPEGESLCGESKFQNFPFISFHDVINHFRD